MSNQFLKLRRSAVQGKIPETSSLDLGELAINTYDGQLFLKKSGSQGEIVTVVGSTGSFTGSFIGNGAGLTSIPASGITGLNLSRIATGSISASVNTDISASFRVTSGSNTLLNVTRDGFVWIGNGSFTNQAYQLDVQGTARVTGDIAAGAYLSIDGDSGFVFFLRGRSGNTYLGADSSKMFFRYGGFDRILVTSNDTTITGYNTTIKSGPRINTYIANVDDFSANNNLNSFTTVFSGPLSTNTFNQIHVSASGSPTSGTPNYRGIYINPTQTGFNSIVAIESTIGGAYFNTTAVVASAILQADSTTKGFLPPRTNSTASITSPAQGLLTYITASGTNEGLWQYRTGSGGWVQLLHNSSSIPASSVVGLNLSQIATGSVTASVSATDISASFRITSGSNTLLNITRDGFVWIGNGSFVNQAYQLDVQGTLRSTGDVQFGSNVYAGNVAGMKLVQTPASTDPYFTFYGAGSVATYAVNIRHRSDRNGLVIGDNTATRLTLNGEGTATINYTGNGIRLFQSSENTVYIGSMQTSYSNQPGRSIIIGYLDSGNDYTTWLRDRSVFLGWSSNISGNQAQTYYFGAGGYIVGGTPKSSLNITFNGAFPSPSTFTDAFGGDFTIAGGRASGIGTPGDVIFSTSNITGSGTALQALADRWWVKGLTGTLSNVSNPPSASLYVSGSFVLNGTQFNNTSSITSAGVTTVSQLSTSSYTSCFYNYTVASASNARSGQVMTVWNGSTIRYTEVVTTDIGDTNQVIVSSSLSSGFVRLQVSASSGWTFKNISNLL